MMGSSTNVRDIGSRKKQVDLLFGDISSGEMILLLLLLLLLPKRQELIDKDQKSANLWV